MNGWKECKLGDVIELVGGGTPKTTVSEYWDGTIPWLSVVDFNNDSKYVYSTEKTITESGFRNSSTKMLQPGAIIISARGTVGAMAVLKKEMAFNQSCYGVKGISGLSDTDYLYYLIKESVNELKQVAHGGVFDTITRETFDQIEILLPSLPEQRAIAGVLSSLDDKIDLLHRQNKTLESMAEALWRKMFVEEADPKWKMGKLGDIADINPMRSIKKGAIAKYLDMSNMPTNGLFPKEWIDREYTSGMKFKNGDTVMARITPCLENGKTAYVNFLDDGEIGWGSTEYIVIAPNDGYCPEWFYFLARNNDFRDFAIQNMTGTSGRQRVSGDSVAQYEISIPESKTLEQFHNFAGPSMDHVKRNSIQIHTLSKLRDSLLPKLMSSEVRVLV